jgi:LPS-assembly protein
MILRQEDLLHSVWIINTIKIEKDQSEDKKDKFFELKLATVIRDQSEDDIPISSTINQKNSDIFGSINNELFDNLNFTYDISHRIMT